METLVCAMPQAQVGAEAAEVEVEKVVETAAQIHPIP